MSLSTIIGVATMSNPVNLALNIGKTLLTETIQLSTSTIRRMLEENPKLSLHTEPIDLYAELHVIDAIVETLPHHITEHPKSKPLRIALENLRQSIDTVHKILEDLNHQIKYHETLYFNTWRTPMYIPLIDQLEKEWKHVLTRKATLLQTTQYLANNALIELSRPPITEKEMKKKNVSEKKISEDRVIAME